MLPRLAARLYEEPLMVHPDTFRQFDRVFQSYLAGNLQVKMEMPGKETKPEAPRGWDIDGGYARTRVSGAIGKHLSMMEIDCGGGFDASALDRALVEIANREDVHTVILSINSPGGQAVGGHETAMLIREVAESGKRTIAWVDCMAASLAYYYAAGCDEIYATPTSIVGSIGCYCAVLDESRALEMEGYKVEAFSSAPGKLYGMGHRPLGDDEKAFFQARVSELGGQFRSFVEARRKGCKAEVVDLGIYGSAESFGISAGLVDGVFLSEHHFFAALLADS